jgi:hypothetical protein
MCIRFMPRNASDVCECDACTELEREPAAWVGSKPGKLEEAPREVVWDREGCQEDRATDAPCRPWMSTASPRNSARGNFAGSRRPVFGKPPQGIERVVVCAHVSLPKSITNGPRHA